MNEVDQARTIDLIRARGQRSRSPWFRCVSAEQLAFGHELGIRLEPFVTVGEAFEALRYQHQHREDPAADEGRDPDRGPGEAPRDERGPPEAGDRMKRGTSDHYKTLRLARALGRPVPQVLGHLHLLWEWCGGHRPHPTGAVGRYEDAEIERRCQWDGRPGDLVQALVEERWLDRHVDPDVRLVVHDWADHCEDSVHRALARACQRFADGRLPKLGQLSAEEKTRAQRAYGLLDSPNDSPRDGPKDSPTDRFLPPIRQPAVAVTSASASAGASTNERTPPSPPSATAAGGQVLRPRQQIERDLDEVVGYWRSLGGPLAPPTKQRRKEIREHLQQGWTVELLKGSAAEHVREQLVKQGRLDPLADWPPEVVNVARPP